MWLLAVLTVLVVAWAFWVSWYANHYGILPPYQVPPIPSKFQHFQKRWKPLAVVFVAILAWLAVVASVLL